MKTSQRQNLQIKDLNTSIDWAKSKFKGFVDTGKPGKVLEKFLNELKSKNFFFDGIKISCSIEDPEGFILKRALEIYKRKSWSRCRNH